MKHNYIKNKAIVSIVSVVALIGLAITSTVPSYAVSGAQGSCTISNVPNPLNVNTSIKPYITVTNTGTVTMTPHMISFFDSAGGTSYFKEKSAGSLAPGSSRTIKLKGYVVSKNDLGAAQVFSHSDLNARGTQVYFECFDNFTVQ